MALPQARLEGILAFNNRFCQIRQLLVNDLASSQSTFAHWGLLACWPTRKPNFAETKSWIDWRQPQQSIG
jgi:hypothetical protein